MSLFGSVLRPDFSAESDIDVLVEFQPEAKVGRIALARLQRDLSHLLGRPVDLVPAGGLKRLIRDEVLAQAEVIFAA